MNGMLWFDNDTSKTLAARLAAAADYFKNKYGQTPNAAQVHPSMITPSPAQGEGAGDGGIRITTSKSILPNHILIGVNKSPLPSPVEDRRDGESAVLSAGVR